MCVACTTISCGVKGHRRGAAGAEAAAEKDCVDRRMSSRVVLGGFQGETTKEMRQEVRFRREWHSCRMLRNWRSGRAVVNEGGVKERSRVAYAQQRPGFAWRPSGILVAPVTHRIGAAKCGVPGLRITNAPSGMPNSVHAGHSRRNLVNRTMAMSLLQQHGLLLTYLRQRYMCRYFWQCRCINPIMTTSLMTMCKPTCLRGL